MPFFDGEEDLKTARSRVGKICQRFRINRRTVARLNKRGKEVGTAPPWDDVAALLNWYRAHYHHVLPEWLRAAWEEEETRNPKPEPSARLVAVAARSESLPGAVHAPPPVAGAPVEGSMKEGSSDRAEARRIVESRRLDLVEHEKLPAYHEGRAVLIRNAQDAYFKALESLRKVETAEDLAQELAAGLMNEAKPYLAQMVNQWCGRLKSTVFDYVPEEKWTEAEECLRRALADFHTELDSVKPSDCRAA